MGERKKRVERTKPTPVWGLWNDYGRFWVDWQDDLFFNNQPDAEEASGALNAIGRPVRVVKLSPIVDCIGR